MLYMVFGSRNENMQFSLRNVRSNLYLSVMGLLSIVLEFVFPLHGLSPASPLF